MAQGCSVPCSARGLRARLQQRYFGDQTYERLPVLLIAGALAVVSPAVLLFAPAVTAIILAGWSAAGVAVVLGQAWLGAATPAAEAMPGEAQRLVEDSAPQVHASRIGDLRRRAMALDPSHPYFEAALTRLLLDLREATGEAWRCPCPRRRLPIPLPF